ncbi:MAG: hypothetical protein QXU29_06355 [Candidatus Nitrosocaldus sp.]
MSTSLAEVSEISIDLDDVIARFMKGSNAYALCERCNCPYDRATGRHLHTGSNLCSDLFECCSIEGYCMD